MHLFWRLYLGHLLADFPFQSNAIFAWKSRNFTGVLVHVGVVVLCTTLMMGPLLTDLKNWALLLILGVAHALQDQLKVAYSKSTGNDGMLVFVADQVGHLLMTIAGVTMFQPATLQRVTWPASWGPWAAIYNNERVIMVLCAMIILTYGTDVARHIRLGTKGPLVRDWYGMVERGCLVVAGAMTMLTPLAWGLLVAWLILRLSGWSRMKAQGLVPAMLSMVAGWLILH